MPKKLMHFKNVSALHQNLISFGSDPSKSNEAKRNYLRGIRLVVPYAVDLDDTDYANSIEFVLSILPESWPTYGVPFEWYMGSMEDRPYGLRMPMSHVASMWDIYEVLKADEAFTIGQLDGIRPAVWDRYLQVISTMDRYWSEEKRAWLVSQLATPQQSGSQFICHWSVSDRSKEFDVNKINWYLQNTSQWLVAGALVIDAKENRVSIHT